MLCRRHSDRMNVKAIHSLLCFIMMHHEDIDEALKNLAFDFFYFFSRFEFALKENGRIQTGPRDVAQADWNSFVQEFEGAYEPCEAAQALLGDPPDVQRVKNRNEWEWHPLAFGEDQSELSKAALAVKTVRNNLFHGGKHSTAGWDDPVRVRFLLQQGRQVLDSFAGLAGFEADYERRY